MSALGKPNTDLPDDGEAAGEDPGAGPPGGLLQQLGPEAGEDLVASVAPLGEALLDAGGAHDLSRGDVLRQPEVVRAALLRHDPHARRVHVLDGLQQGARPHQVRGLRVKYWFVLSSSLSDLYVAVGGAELNGLGPLGLVSNVPDVEVGDVVGQGAGAGVGDQLDRD